MFERVSHPKIVFILIAISYIFLMAGNGIISLTHPDEVFYVQTAKEMLARHSWLTPYIFDQPQFEKPIFTYWLLMIAVKFFGLTAFAARFWPAAFGMIGVLATYWLGMMLFKNKRAAFLSAVILSTSLIYLALSRSVLTDMIFSIWVVLSLAFFYHGLVEPKQRAKAIVLCFAASGLAVLTKGILGFIFPFLIIAGYLSYIKEGSYFKNKATLFGILLFLVIAVPWHVLMMKWYGQSFTNEYFWNVHVRRILEAEHLKSNTWHFYPMTVFAGVFPWSLFLFPAGYLAFEKLKSENPLRRQFVFLLLSLGVVLFMMQSAQSKLASYIFPVFPFLALLLGYYFESVLQNKGGLFFEKVTKAFFYVMSAVIALLAIASIVACKKFSSFVSAMEPAYVCAGLLLVISVVIFVAMRKNRYFMAIGFTPLVLVVVLVFAFWENNSAEPWVSCQGICDVFKKMKTPSDSTLLCSKFYVRGIRFYTDRKTAVVDINGKQFFSPHPIPFLDSDDKILTFLNSQTRTYCFLKKGDVNALKRIAGSKFAIRQVDEIGGKFLLIVDKI